MTDRYTVTAYGIRLGGDRHPVAERGGLEHEPARQQFKFYRDRGAWRIKVYKSINDSAPILITDWRDIRR